MKSGKARFRHFSELTGKIWQRGFTKSKSAEIQNPKEIRSPAQSAANTFKASELGGHATFLSFEIFRNSAVGFRFSPLFLGLCRLSGNDNSDINELPTAGLVTMHRHGIYSRFQRRHRFGTDFNIVITRHVSLRSRGENSV